MAAANVIEVGESNFDEAVLTTSSDVPVVVDFWAGWCRPCLVLGPVLERLADEYDGRFVLAKVDVDANPGLAARYGIQGIPAVKAFRDGRVASEFVGAQPEAVVRSFLDGIVPSAADDLASSGARLEGSGDLDGAEAAYRKALEIEPDHPRAGVGLARLLAARGADADARSILARLPADDDARRLASLLSLRAGDGDGAPSGSAAAAAAAGDYRRALEEALRLISGGGDDRERARDLMIRVFDVLGDDHPLTREFRPRLAAALF
ncbi:MAG TPA: tetratricopeptide repeat protein [Actinomycetota bacterium]|nr:tetratricopeptide repeat protein [Actinomycetota bacterium]